MDTKPASRSTCRCVESVDWDTASASQSSQTQSSPLRKAARTRTLVGSANAFAVKSNSFTTQTYRQMPMHCQRSCCKKLNRPPAVTSGLPLSALEAAGRPCPPFRPRPLCYAPNALLTSDIRCKFSAVAAASVCGSMVALRSGFNTLCAQSSSPLREAGFADIRIVRKSDADAVCMR